MLLLVGLLFGAQRLFFIYYQVPSQNMSLIDAREIDKQCDNLDMGAILQHDYYIDPIIKNPPQEWEVKSLLRLRGADTKVCSFPCCGSSRVAPVSDSEESSGESNSSGDEERGEE